MEQRERPWYCTDCGVRLDGGHRFCWNCGARRWDPPEPASAGEAPAGAGGSKPSAGPSPAGQPPAGPGVRRVSPPRGAGASADPAAGSAPASPLGGVKLFFAVGGIFFLVLLAHDAAVLAAPAGRESLLQGAPSMGLAPGDAGVILDVWAVLLLLEVLAAGLHAAAYYGIRRYRVSGWVVGVLVAGIWSVVLVGIPTLYVLLKRSTRERFGLA